MYLCIHSLPLDPPNFFDELTVHTVGNSVGSAGEWAPGASFLQITDCTSKKGINCKTLIKLSNVKIDLEKINPRTNPQ